MTTEKVDPARLSASAHPTVDVHCHTFNGSDLPVEGFVKHVLLRDNDWPNWVKARLARRADRMVQPQKFGYEPERTTLDEMLAAPPEGLALLEAFKDATDSAFEEQVTQDLRALMAEDPDTAAAMGVGFQTEGFSVRPSDARAFIAFARNPRVLASTSRGDSSRRIPRSRSSRRCSWTCLTAWTTHH